MGERGGDEGARERRRREEGSGRREGEVGERGERAI